VEFRELGGM